MKRRLPLFFFLYGLLLAVTGVDLIAGFSDTHRLFGGYVTVLGVSCLGMGWWVRRAG